MEESLKTSKEIITFFTTRHGYILESKFESCYIQNIFHFIWVIDPKMVQTHAPMLLLQFHPRINLQ